MADKRRFAVVDLETTGSSYKKGERIIQFGCTFIENSQIVDSFEVKINPEKQISKEIEELTGVTNAMVANAPYFSDLADLLYTMLTPCVFVAHNVNFDFNFLNKEFQRAGHQSLKIPAIDTVVLSRVLLPYQSSYSLTTLDDELDLGLGQAHDAGEDARATAELFLVLADRARNLPQITLDQLKDLSTHYPMDTRYFFNWIDQTGVSAERPDLLEVGGLALQKEPATLAYQHRADRSYPKTDQEKSRLFKDQLELRTYQTKLMDAIYAYLNGNDEGQFLIQAPSGIGKTLAYLLPATYLSSPDHKTVISTYSIVLQHQMIEKDLAMLAELLPFDLSLALIKGQSHYLDLASFSNYLQVDQLDSVEASSVGQILVWLTETVTGDLDEIQDRSQSHPFWDRIRSRSHKQMIEDSLWAAYDFFLKSRKKADQADLIITNHAYIAKDVLQLDDIFGKGTNYIIDEAHQLIDFMRSAAVSSFSFQKLIKYIEREWLVDSQFKESSQLVNFSHDMTLLNQNFSYLYYQALSLRDQFIDQLHLLEVGQEDLVEQVFTSEDLSPSLLHQLRNMQASMDETMAVSQQVIEQGLTDFDHLSSKEKSYIENFYGLTQEFSQIYFDFSHINQLLQLQAAQGKPAVFWLRKLKQQALIHFSLQTYSHEVYKKKIAALKSLDQLVYLSATPQSIQHIYQSDKERQLAYYEAESPYDYRQQTALVLPEKLPPIQSLSSEKYEAMLAHYIELLADQTDQSCLVLFNSIQTMNRVYDRLKQRPIHKDLTFLVQGHHGSKQRMIKQYKKMPRVFLFGSSAFWEGLDLPGDALPLLVVTRLPFESPQALWSRIRSYYSDMSPQEFFFKDSLPRAVQKLGQAFGRLVRGPDDRGIMVVLDDRLVNASYHKTMQTALPADTPFVYLPDTEFYRLNHFFSSWERGRL